MEDLPFPLAAEDDVPRETIYEIGALIVTAAIADFGVGIAIVRLVSGQKAPINLRATPLVAGMDFKVKLAILRVLATPFPSPEVVARIHQICDRLQEVYQRRNEVTHFTPDEHKDGRTYFVSMKRSGKTGEVGPPKPYSKEQIRGWSREMDALTLELSDILDAYGFADIPEDDDQLPSDAG